MWYFFGDKYQVRYSVFFLDRSGGVESTAVSTLHRSIEKNMPKISSLPIFPHLFILALFLMTSQRQFWFSFPEEMDASIDFLFVYVAYF